MENGIIIFPDVDMVFTDRQQDGNIFLGYDMALTKNRVFGNASDNLRNIVAENMTDSVFRFHHFHNF